MNIHYHVHQAIDTAMAMLPSAMDTREARVMMLAIGLQESRFTHRWQVLDGGRKGPARGYWQFEQGGGCKGVLQHAASRYWMRAACEARGIDPTPAALWRAIETDDVLAAVAARLLLFTDRFRLPAITDSAAAWQYYVRNWRPGKPHPETWPECHRTAVESMVVPA